MDNETWILPEEALSYGFATTVDKTENENASQSAWLQLFDIIKAHQEKDNEEDKEPENDPDDDEQEEPDNDETEPETDSENNSNDEEERDEEEQSEEEEDTETDEEKEAAQLWSGFFNALIK